MKYKQGQAVFITMTLPDGKVARHPFLIISCAAANSRENFYTGVMMTASHHKDRFSFPLSDDMFDAPVNKHSAEIRTYIIASFREANIEGFCNTMKKTFFRKVLLEIKEYVLACDS